MKGTQSENKKQGVSLKRFFISAMITICFMWIAGCDFFDPRDYARNLTPVDSMAVFHNLIDSYNTLDYEKYLLSIDSSSFVFIPEDSTRGIGYTPWNYSDESKLTLKMFNQLNKSRRIPPLLLQVDTTYFSANDTLAYLNANYLILTDFSGYETLAGGLKLEIIKRGNYWYVSSWKDVTAETLFTPHIPVDSTDTVKKVDTLPPLVTTKDWSDFKVYFRTAGT